MKLIFSAVCALLCCSSFAMTVATSGTVWKEEYDPVEDEWYPIYPPEVDYHWSQYSIDLANIEEGAIVISCAPPNTVSMTIVQKTYSTGAVTTSAYYTVGTYDHVEDEWIYNLVNVNMSGDYTTSCPWKTLMDYPPPGGWGGPGHPFPPGGGPNDNDGDGIPDATDPDDDNDGVPDASDPFPKDPKKPGPGGPGGPGTPPGGGPTDPGGPGNPVPPDPGPPDPPGGGDPPGGPYDPGGGTIPGSPGSLFASFLFDWSSVFPGSAQPVTVDMPYKLPGQEWDAWELSSYPDTTTTWGNLLNILRVTFRTLFVFVIAFKFAQLVKKTLVNY